MVDDGGTAGDISSYCRSVDGSEASLVSSVLMLFPRFIIPMIKRGDSTTKSNVNPIIINRLIFIKILRPSI